MSINLKMSMLLFLMLVSIRLCAADYNDKLKNHQGNGFFGISDRPPISQNQANNNNGSLPASIANFLPSLPSPNYQQPVLIDEDFIYENASDEYLLYEIEEQE